MGHFLKKLVIPIIVVTFSVSNVILPTSRASVIDTSSYLQTQNNSVRSELQGLLAREDVRNQLISLGVQPDDAQKRLAALTGEELVQLQKQIDELPAGSSALAVIGAVFLVLLILELVGVTDIFTKM
jgi:hypothetical protein